MRTLILILGLMSTQSFAQALNAQFQGAWESRCFSLTNISTGEVRGARLISLIDGSSRQGAIAEFRDLSCKEFEGSSNIYGMKTKTIYQDPGFTIVEEVDGKDPWTVHVTYRVSKNGTQLVDDQYNGLAPEKVNPAYMKNNEGLGQDVFTRTSVSKIQEYLKISIPFNE